MALASDASGNLQWSRTFGGGFVYGMKDTYRDILPEEAYTMLMDENFDLIIDVVGLMTRRQVSGFL